jgi:hypothetical protein
MLNAGRDRLATEKKAALAKGLPRRLPSSNEAASLWERYEPLPHLPDLLQGPQGRLGDSWI